jgi:hypothetical protein
MKKFKWFFFCLLVILTASCDKNHDPNSKEIKKFGQGYRFDKEGWVYIHIEGAAFERGKQYGFLIADEYKKAQDAYKLMAYETTGMDFAFFVNQGAELHKNKIPPELMDEMRGMVAGLKEAGIESSIDDIIGWNSYVEITSNWWPKAQDKFTGLAPSGKSLSKCSAFIATGKATKDGKIVVAHSTFDDFWNAQFDNIILDILPDQGNRIIMQTEPLFLSSMEDFYVTSAGIIAVETTLANFNGYDETKTPGYVRIRMAMQYGNDIESVVQILNEGNNGGVADAWLIGDIKTNEIARFEQGLLYQKLDKKFDGYFFGCNVAEDPRIRNLECSAEQGYNDIRRHTGSRRVRWQEVLEENYGKIDADIAMELLADHYDVYLKKNNPSATSICAHYDNDPRYNMSSPSATHPNPFTPAGSIDGKVTTSELAKKLSFWARYGRGCGTPFDAEKFIKENAQWSWQKEVLKSRASYPWVFFTSNDKP